MGVESRLHFAHPLPAAHDFCGREAERRELARRCAAGGVVFVEGLGGAGKTALLADLAEALESAEGFVWSFYVEADADAMLNALQAHLESLAGEVDDRGTVALISQRRERFLLLLDGFERMQSAAPPHEINDVTLREFLERLAALPEAVSCICATRVAVPFESGTAVLRLDGLDDADATRLLRARGLEGAEQALAELARAYGGHPLTLSLVAGAVLRYFGGDPARHVEVCPRGSVDAPWLGRMEEALTRVLGFYRAALSAEAAAILERLSLFRGPAHEHTLEHVFAHSAAIGGPLFGLLGDALQRLLEELRRLGLVERVDEQRWVAHAVVRDFFPPALSEAPRMHVAVASFLGEPPASSRPPTPTERAMLEEAIHHALVAGEKALAEELYKGRLRGTAWLCNEGDLARAERILRAMSADSHDVAWWREADLASVLQRQGRVDEAARLAWRAYRKARRVRRRGARRDVLERLLRIALLRGRLPLMEKLASRLAEEEGSLGFLVDQELSSAAFLRYAGHLRAGHGPSAAEWGRTDFEWLARDVALRTDVVNAPWVRASAELRYAADLDLDSMMLVLQRMQAQFALSVHQPQTLPVLAASRLLRDRTLHRAVERLRSCGCRPGLVMALIFRARLHRLVGDSSGALNDLEEAESLSRRYGLTLRLIETLLEARHFHGDAPVREALSLATRPDIDYGWGAVEAAGWLSLHEQMEGPLLESSMADWMETVRKGVVAGRGLPSTDGLQVDVGTALFRGVDPLEAIVEVPGPAGLRLAVPVERGFAADLEALRLEESDEALRRRYDRLWAEYYASQMRDRDHAGPVHHLSVLLCFEGRQAHAAALGDDLRLCRPPFPGAACVAAACAPTISRAIEILIDAIEREREVVALSVTACNLALLLAQEGRTDDARRACERALKADWQSSRARALLRRLDAVEEREKCCRMLRHAAHAVETWRATLGKYPQALDDLTRGLMRAVPSCPRPLTPYRYLISTSGTRALIACPHHRLRHDTRRGNLTPIIVQDAPDASTVRLHRMLRAIGNDIGASGGRLLVTAHRAHKIVE